MAYFYWFYLPFVKRKKEWYHSKISMVDSIQVCVYVCVCHDKSDSPDYKQIIILHQNPISRQKKPLTHLLIAYDLNSLLLKFIAMEF